jgi:signal transduction histidine kinase
MDEEEITNVFNPFYTRKKYGTGLGMTHVKKIIDLHQGNVEIKSRKGEGTTIVLFASSTSAPAWSSKFASADVPEHSAVLVIPLGHDIEPVVVLPIPFFQRITET